MRERAILLVSLFGTMSLLNFLASKGWWPAIDWPLLDQLIAYLIREVHPENIKLIVAIAATLFWRRPYYGYRHAIEKKFNARFNGKTIQSFGWKKPSYYASLSHDEREDIRDDRKKQLRQRSDKLRTWRVKFDRLKQRLTNYLHRSKLTKRGKGYQIMQSLQEEIDEERKLDDLYEAP